MPICADAGPAPEAPRRCRSPHRLEASPFASHGPRSGHERDTGAREPWPAPLRARRLRAPRRSSLRFTIVGRQTDPDRLRGIDPPHSATTMSDVAARSSDLVGLVGTRREPACAKPDTPPATSGPARCRRASLPRAARADAGATADLLASRPSSRRRSRLHRSPSSGIARTPRSIAPRRCRRHGTAPDVACPEYSRELARAVLARSQRPLVARCTRPRGRGKSGTPSRALVSCQRLECPPRRCQRFGA